MPLPSNRLDYREVVYDPHHWNTLEKLRARAQQIMTALDFFHITSVVHGSTARGDVTVNSDIDIFIPTKTSSFLVETALAKAEITPIRRFVVQATPTYAMKAYIELMENTCISFPLMKMRRVEREFYKFGGEVTNQKLSGGIRVCGVDKRLMLIEPTKLGHTESSIVGLEDQTAKRLGISLRTVSDRVTTLLRREKLGRTGLFIEKDLPTSEPFEMALKKLADENPAVRRRLKMR